GKAQNWPTARRGWSPTLVLAEADEVAQASLGLAHRAATLFSDQLPEPCMPGLLVGDQLGGEAAIFDLADDLAYARASVVVEEGADVRMNAVLTGRRGVLLHHRIEADPRRLDQHLAELARAVQLHDRGFRRIAVLDQNLVRELERADDQRVDE